MWGNILLSFWFSFPWWLLLLSFYSYNCWTFIFRGKGNCLFKSFVHFSTELVGLLLLSFSIMLQINLGYYFFVGVMICKYFSCSFGCLFVDHFLCYWKASEFCIIPVACFVFLHVFCGVLPKKSSRTPVCWSVSITSKFQIINFFHQLRSFRS